MLSWTEVTNNWTQFVDALASRFPALEAEMLTAVPVERDNVAEQIARRHDLTMPEARDELENLMLIQGLARRAGDLRA